MFPIWGDSCILCFFSGDLLRPPHPGSRVRPGAMWRWRVSVSGWMGASYFSAECSFRPPAYKSGWNAGEWAIKSSAGLRHNWGRASSLFICCHIGIPRCKNILWDFVKAIAKQKAVKRPIRCCRNSLYPRTPSIFFNYQSMFSTEP